LCALQARLQADVAPTQQDTLDNVRVLKETIQRDLIDPDTGRPFFDPSLIRRGYLWPEKNVFTMVPASEAETDAAHVKRLRTKFKNKILQNDFQADQKTEL